MPITRLSHSAGLKGKTGNQLALPAAQQSKFELGDCFDPTDPALPANGDFPTFNVSVHYFY
jgi:hypothetical protein